MNLRYSFAVFFASILLVSVGIARIYDLTPDAVTRATTWNYYEGELAYLTDGKTPIETPDAGVFTWLEKGILLIEFPEPVELAQVRVFTGERVGKLTLDAYLGGRRHEYGGYRAPKGELKASLIDASMASNSWLDFRFEPPVQMDNLELITQAATDYYEIQLNGPEDVSVKPTLWKNVKMIFR